MYFTLFGCKESVGNEKKRKFTPFLFLHCFSSPSKYSSFFFFFFFFFFGGHAEGILMAMMAGFES
jgi:hypothetical protein